MAKIKGYLTLIGDNFDTSSVTKILGVVPTWERKRTEILKNGSLFGHCEWGIDTDIISTEDISDVTDKLFLPLTEKMDTLGKIAESFNAEWNILFWVRVMDDFPCIALSSQFVRAASSIGAAIGFDVYLLN